MLVTWQYRCYAQVDNLWIKCYISLQVLVKVYMTGAGGVGVVEEEGKVSAI